MPLTPADVRNKQFSTTRLRPGYDEEEVDAFLDEVEGELDRLIQENEELRAKLAECLPGGRSAAPALSSPLSDPRPEMMVPAPAGMAPAPEMPLPAPVPMQEQQHRPEPAVTDASSSNMNSVARVLSLAQQTADQAVADARREADEALGRARREVDDILGNARRQAKQITREARARAESLERDAQERHRQAMGSLPQLREGLERQVDDLRAFEREYLARILKITQGNVTQAARLAGRNRTEFYRLLDRHALQPSMFKVSSHSDSENVESSIASRART
jgi:DivIVA domain-containing protein